MAKLKAELYDYKVSENSLGTIWLEFVAIALLAWKMSDMFLVGVLCFFVLSYLFGKPGINIIMSFLLTGIWCFFTYLLIKPYFSWTTILGIELLVFFIILGIHLSAADMEMALADLRNED